MRVEFHATGGMVGRARVVSPVTLDDSGLGEADRRALERLVRNARFFELPAQLNGSRGSVDRVCRITIEHLGQRHSVCVSEPVHGPALRRLIDRIRTIAAPRRVRQIGDTQSGHSIGTVTRDCPP